jgi:hypothetical protein
VSEEHTDTPVAVSPVTWRWKSVPMLLLEVVLITAGVFLGLLGEQWRENVENRRLATAALKQFRDEFMQNRGEVDRVHQRHVDQLKNLREYLRANGEALVAHTLDRAKPIPLPVPETVTDSAGVDFAAWDLALATQSLAHIDAQLVADMSSAYTMQRVYWTAHGSIQQASYAISDPVMYINGVTTWLGDAVLYERLMKERYDNLIPRLAKAIADSE